MLIYVWVCLYKNAVYVCMCGIAQTSFLATITGASQESNGISQYVF
jgi:hypothetical protein